MSEAQAAEGPLTIDAAIGLLGADPPPEENDAPAAETDEIEVEPPAEDEAAPLEDGASGDEPAEEDPDLPAIDPPQSWGAEERDEFAQLPRQAQEIIAAREAERDRRTSKAIQEASDARKAAESEVHGVTSIKATLDQVLPQVLQSFQNEWADWTPENQIALSQSDPAAFVARKAKFDLQQQNLARLQAAHQESERVAFDAFVRTEAAKLPQLAPDLADPVKGPERKTALATYIQGLGVDPAMIARLDATTVATAYKAMKYDELMARGVRPDKQPAPKPAVKPTASAPARTPQRAAEAAKNRFAQTRSVDDAIALMNSRSGA